MTENEISKLVVDAGLRVHRIVGPGLLESAYEACLFYELQNLRLKVEKQKPLPLIYEDVKLDVGYRVDLLVEEKLIIEVKAVDFIQNIHIAQILTYLRLSNCKLGMILNFNSLLFKAGVKRIVNGL